MVRFGEVSTTSTASGIGDGDAPGLARPREMTIPGMHAAVMREIVRTLPPAGAPRVLDLGAGEGALALRLREAGYQVAACDLDPTLFRVPGLECRAAGEDGALPYESASFDLVACVEVVEHLESQRRLFAEVHRVLRPGGRFVMTTPNIASLKSRLTFMFTGYPYSHGPLDPGELEPRTQHIAPFALDRYRWLLRRCGFDVERVMTDRWQRSSLLLAGLWPLVQIAARWRWGRSQGVAEQNSGAVLFGRTLFVVARRRDDGGEWTTGDDHGAGARR